MQTAPEALLPGGGMTYCGPVAASNGIVWLARNGYPRLAAANISTSAPVAHTEPRAQGDLARQLGSYMGTTCRRGTDVTRFLTGLNGYINHRWHAIGSLKFQGWERHPGAYSTGVTVPDLNWIKTGLAPDSVAWLLIGWYRHDARFDTYQLFAQHWVTVVGAGYDRNGRPAPNMLVVHDSAPRSGPAMHHDFISFEPITHGSFSRYCGRPSLSTRGWYKVGGDLRLKSGSHCGIIDGAVVMRMLKPAPATCLHPVAYDGTPCQCRVSPVSAGSVAN